MQNQTESPEAGATSSLFPSLHSSCHHTLSFWILCCIENFKNVTFQGVALTRNTSSKFSIFVDDISFQPKTATLQPFVFCMLSSQGKGWLAPVGFLQKKDSAVASLQLGSWCSVQSRMCFLHGMLGTGVTAV